MQVTDVRVFLADEERLKGYATVTFDNCFVVRDLKIINGNNGYFVAMPSKKRKDGTHKDIAHPINTDFRQRIEELVIDEYKAELGRSESQHQAEEKSGSIQRKIVKNDSEEVIQKASETVPFDSSYREFEAGVGPKTK